MNFLQYVVAPVVLLLGLSACNDAFLVSTCAYDPDRPGCQPNLSTPPALDMAQDGGSDGGMPMHDLLPSSRDPVKFDCPAEAKVNLTASPFLFRWAGIRGDNTLIFTEQADLKTIIKPMRLNAFKPSPSFTTNSVCSDCPVELNFKLSNMMDRISVGKTKFFLSQFEFNWGGVCPIKPDGSKGANIYSANGEERLLSPRIYVSPENDQVALITPSKFLRVRGEDSAIDLPLLINSSLAAWVPGLRRLDKPASLAFSFDGNELKILRWRVSLTGETEDPEPGRINGAIKEMSMAPIEAVRIADLNNDGNKELILAQSKTIRIITYFSDNNTVLTWPMPLYSADTKINSISTADLDKDGDLDLAIETESKVLFCRNTLND
jgi:hypothetical protein